MKKQSTKEKVVQLKRVVDTGTHGRAYVTLTPLMNKTICDLVGEDGFSVAKAAYLESVSQSAVKREITKKYVTLPTEVWREIEDDRRERGETLTEYIENCIHHRGGKEGRKNVYLEFLAKHR